MSYFYAVTNGRNIGIYTNWLECKKQIDGFSNATYKKFKNQNEAIIYISNKKEEMNPIYEEFKNPFIYIFTDGACSNNGHINAKAGIGVFFGDNDIRNISEKLEGKQTNNTAELIAIKRAIEISDDIKDKMIIICSDSEYAIKCCTTYGNKLEAIQWTKDIPNKELVKEIYYMCKGKNIQFKHIMAHTNKLDIFSYGNDKADLLANNAISNIQKVPNEWSPRVNLKNYIYVSFVEKDNAKKLGAKWDSKKKLWYYENNLDKDNIKQLQKYIKK